MRYLSIKNLSKHQHYKDRRPPWIKLHAEVLDDYAFSCLQDASKAHLMLLWVLASRMENRIPYDLAWITQKVGAQQPVDLEELIAHGFIEVHDDASAVLAPRKRSAMPETETETEKKTSPVAGAPGGGQRPRGKGEPAPYMGQLAPVWQAAYGGKIPKGAATHLRPVVNDVGVDEAVARFTRYCAETEARFANVAKFAQTHGAYCAEARSAAAGKAALAELQELGKQDPWWTSGLRVPA